MPELGTTLRQTRGFIWLHVKSGYPAGRFELITDMSYSSACKVAMAMLREGGCALDAVEIAIRLLEDSEITNAGYGSNLNTDGVVEMDALIMEGNGMSGAVGAATCKLHLFTQRRRYLIPASNQESDFSCTQHTRALKARATSTSSSASLSCF